MTNDTSSALAPRGERGMALIAALLLLLVISGLAAALTTSGRVEVAMGDNEELYAGARAAAESGLNRAAAQILALTNNPSYVLNDLLQGPDGLVDPGNLAAMVNADNGLMTHLPDMGGAVPWPVAAGSEYSYDVRLFDDDDPFLNQPSGTPFSTVELAAMAGGAAPQWLPEDGNPVSDVNKRIVIRSTGFGPRGTQVVVEQMLSPIKMPALLVNGDLILGGNASIEGAQGSVHANGNLLVDGSSVFVEQSATATGTLTANTGWSAGDVTSGGMPEIPVPDIRASDYLDDADFILRSDGLISNRDGTTIYCNASTSKQGQYDIGCRDFPPPGGTGEFGWRFNSTTSTWDLNPGSATTNQATYYAEADVTVTGSPGTAAQPLRITIIAEGDIEVTGNPDLRPEPSSEVQFVTDQDLRLAGNLTIPTAYEGRILVREQIDFAGTIDLAGQVIVQNTCAGSTTAPCSDLIVDNEVRGTATLTYNGLIETVAYTVSGWRETP